MASIYAVTKLSLIQTGLNILHCAKFLKCLSSLPWTIALYFSKFLTAYISALNRAVQGRAYWVLITYGYK